MSMAVCDPMAFYPLRNLIEGPFTDLGDLTEVERFVRTVVLHDEISMELEPWPYDPDSVPEIAEAGQRNVIVAVGPVLIGYDFFTNKPDNGNLGIQDVKLSSALVEVVRNFSNAEEANVYYRAHIEYLQRIISIVQNEGSALLSGEFGSAAIGDSSKYPEKLFENLDLDWQQFAREADAGECGFMVPPVLSIILTLK